MESKINAATTTTTTKNNNNGNNGNNNNNDQKSIYINFPFVAWRELWSFVGS
jgi:hypothetical protein